MLVVGLIVGAIGLAVGFILDWLGWIDSGTMWDMAQWGFSIGNGIGLIMGILGFKDLHKGATEPWSGSSSSSSSGLKTASFTDSGTLYHLTQDSPYSECDYTDQFGGKWGRDSSGFYRK